MEIIKHEFIKIIAEQGKVLTNGEDYADKITLGSKDSPENWHEITKEEYNIILEQEKQEELKELEKM